MTASRRDFLVGTGAAIAVANLPVSAHAADADKATEALLAEMAEELLVDYPESATGLGIDTGARAALKAKLTDRSVEGQRAIAQRAAKRLQRLKAIDTSHLSDATRIDVDVMRTSHEFASEGFAFPYGDVATLNQNWSYRNAPYVVAQNTGAFLEIPSMMDTRHTVETRADADAYLSRLEAYAGQIDGETARLKAAASQGVIAPDFLLDKTLSQLRMASGGNIAEWTLVTSLANRTKNIPGDYAAKAAKIAKDKIAPALQRQLAELQAHRKRATSDAGVWKLPKGDEYYAWALSAATTTRMTPDQIHELGQQELRALQAEMDVILKAQGLTQGTVGERMTELGKQARFQFPEGDKGREQIMALLHDRVKDIRTRLPRAFATLVPGNLQIQRMAPEVEPGAPGAYGGAGTIDGKVPGKFWINLRTTDLWTTYSLPTLTYHESIPGHVWQGEYTFKLPLFRSLLAFNAFAEGWALYAEQLAAELGVYDNDPVGRLGYLQSIAFRACRLVVDTGLHAKRWTRQQAIEWFAKTNGSGLEEVTSEVDRYCAWPGQACGYKVGHSEINRLRKKAQQALGTKFDFRKFNDAVVQGGDVPMVVLARSIDGFIAKG
ncbi:DUF885 domain-containing protein [Steroidobacter sp.]|uniref:DUF885 domain-containing protein n=1 Tax=Steroidobacter sp. TaxID=1978227 RepID=UPI001A5EE341|nr:DUF885 family protein [Steroidobacter sp.]MBL8268416.1 DUF885 family protein [Steroidobacter sp.]